MNNPNNLENFILTVYRDGTPELSELATKFFNVSCENCKHCTTYNPLDSCNYYYYCEGINVLRYFEPKE
jgi:hypothetical protein